MSTNAITSLKLAQAYVNAMINQDADAMASIFAPELQFKLLPASLNAPSIPDRDAFIGLLKTLWKLMRSMKLDILDVNSSSTKVWVHVFGSADLYNGGTYKAEYVYMWDVIESEDGVLRIVKFNEFVDSVAAKTLLAAIGPSSE